MVKIAPGDIKAILRQFNVVGAHDSEKHSESIKTASPSQATTIISFRFNKRRYCIIVDDTAEDDVEYLTELATSETDATEGGFIKNPNVDFATYGLPFKGKTVYLYLAQADKRRLDVVLAENYPDTSRSTWQKHIKASRVTVNNETIVSPRHEVTPADNIALHLPEQTDYSAETFPIVYLDDTVIVINKPVGALTHAKGALSEEFTVADFFRRYTKVGLDTNRPGIIHRLDRDTSGILVGARTEAAAKLLARQFAERKVKKTYMAVVSGHLREKEATIELPIDRNPSAPSTFRVDPKGKMAITHYTVVAENERETLVELRPITGRTHQLRVHMAYLGAPIKGDRIYGKESQRLYLHAKKLEITIPEGDRRVFEAPLPEEFTASFKERG